MHNIFKKGALGIAGLAMLLIIAALSAGCGGQATLPPPSNRGEGDIPVGRLKGPSSEDSEVTIIGSDHHEYRASVQPSSGTIMSPELPQGEATVLVRPADPSVEPLEFPLIVGPNESYVANVQIRKSRPSALITGMTIELMGQYPIVVGEPAPVRVTIYGTNVGGLKPTIWVDGGVGTLDVGNRFIGTQPGIGSVHAEALGFSAQIEVTVH